MALITPLESTFRPIALQCSFNVAMNTYRARFSIHVFSFITLLTYSLLARPAIFLPFVKQRFFLIKFACTFLIKSAFTR